MCDKDDKWGNEREKGQRNSLGKRGPGERWGIKLQLAKQHILDNSN